MNICLPLYSLMTESLPYRNQSIDLLYKPMDWFLYDNGLHHERVKESICEKIFLITYQNKSCSLSAY